MVEGWGNVCGADRRRGTGGRRKSFFLGLCPVFGRAIEGRLIPGDGGKAWLGSFMNALRTECVACESSSSVSRDVRLSAFLSPLARRWRR